MCQGAMKWTYGAKSTTTGTNSTDTRAGCSTTAMDSASKGGASRRFGQPATTTCYSHHPTRLIAARGPQQR